MSLALASATAAAEEEAGGLFYNAMFLILLDISNLQKIIKVGSKVTGWGYRAV